jgi:hypothetical protein
MVDQPGPHADLNGRYATDPTEFIAARAPDFWVHGHVHTRRDYCAGATRIVWVAALRGRDLAQTHGFAGVER